MQDNQRDDLDIEIVDIDDKMPYEKRVPPLSLNMRFFPRQRRMQAIVTISVVILVLLGLIASNTALRRKLLNVALLPTPTFTQAIPAGTDRFYVDGEPEWGRLFVDGKLIAHPPNAYTGDAPLRLLRGVHTLRWLAAPFLPQMCTVSVPPSYRTDTC